VGDLEAVRARDLQWFFQRWYRPDNAHLVVAGAVDPAAVRAVVTRYFSDVPARGARPPRWRAAPLAITAARTLRVQAGVGRPSLRVIWSAPGGCDPQAADLDLVASLLTRRLRVALVDAGLAFEVSAEQGDDLDDARFQVTVVGVPEHTAEAMLERLDAVLRDVAARGPARARARSHRHGAARAHSPPRGRPARARVPGGEAHAVTARGQPTCGAMGASGVPSASMSARATARERASRPRGATS
jgi:predicted Zn-dependent peptidase